VRRRREDRELARRLAELAPPGEAAARERARATVTDVFRAREPVRRRARRGVLGVAVVVALGMGVAATGPPGQAVAQWLRDVVASEPAAPAAGALRLPAAGRLLVTSDRGVWVVNRKGARRRLGAYSEATWSPGGRFVAVTTGRDLVALEPTGAERWTISPPGGVTDVRWAPGDGYRVASRAGDHLRIVAGDGTGDRPLAGGVASVAPAWRPAAPAPAPVFHVLAWVEAGGGLIVADVDTPKGRIVRAPLPGAARVRSLSWSPGGTRLLAASTDALRIYAVARDRLEHERTVRLARGERVVGAAYAPAGGARVGFVLRDGPADRSELRLLGRERPLLAVSGLLAAPVWSPDGDWLLTPWENADQWLLASAAGRPEVAAAADVSRRFDPGTRAPGAASPRVEGWCCVAAR
jgi:hypothetical protein